MVEIVLHLIVLRKTKQVAVLHVEEVLWLRGGGGEGVGDAGVMSEWGRHW